MKPVKFENFFYGPELAAFRKSINQESGWGAADLITEDLPGDLLTYYVQDDVLNIDVTSPVAGTKQTFQQDSSRQVEWYHDFNVIDIKGGGGFSARVQDKDVYRVITGLKPLFENAGFQNVKGLDEGIKIEEDRKAKLHAAVQFALSFGKMAGGIIRFISEDIYNGACQLIYLCKVWNHAHTTNGTKAFVMCSIAAGCCASLMGPIAEAFVLRRLKSKAPTDADYFGYDKIPDAPDKRNALEQEQQHAEQSVASRPHDGSTTEHRNEQLNIPFEYHLDRLDPAIGKQLEAQFESMRSRVNADLLFMTPDGRQWKLIAAGSLAGAGSDPEALFQAFQELKLPCRVHFDLHLESTDKEFKQQQSKSEVANKNIRKFVLESANRKSRWGHRMLMTTAVCYWGGNGIIYFFADVQCGMSAPKWAWLTFFCSSTVALLAEIWILIHCKFGYRMFSECDGKLLLGIFLGILGRFDSFSDVTNAVAIQNCVKKDPPSFSWFSVYGHVYHLPTDLGTLVKSGLVLILILQLIPGLALLATRKLITTALKLNEFCLVLSAMEAELQELDADMQQTTEED